LHRYQDIRNVTNITGRRKQAYLGDLIYTKIGEGRMSLSQTSNTFICRA